MNRRLIMSKSLTGAAIVTANAKAYAATVTYATSGEKFATKATALYESMSLAWATALALVENVTLPDGTIVKATVRSLGEANGVSGQSIARYAALGTACLAVAPAERKALIPLVRPLVTGSNVLSTADVRSCLTATYVGDPADLVERLTAKHAAKFAPVVETTPVDEETTSDEETTPVDVTPPAIETDSATVVAGLMVTAMDAILAILRIEGGPALVAEEDYKTLVARVSAMNDARGKRARTAA